MKTFRESYCSVWELLAYAGVVVLIIAFTIWIGSVSPGAESYVISAIVIIVACAIVDAG